MVKASSYISNEEVKLMSLVHFSFLFPSVSSLLFRVDFPPFPVSQPARSSRRHTAASRSQQTERESPGKESKRQLREIVNSKPIVVYLARSSDNVEQ